MKKLIIEYNPTYETHACPDGFAESRVSTMWEVTNNSNQEFQHFVTSSEVIIVAARCLVAEGKIPYEQIEFIFEGKTLTFNNRYTLSDWPRGFCDVLMNFSGRILRTCNFRKKK